MTINALFILVSVFLFVFSALGIFPGYHMLEWGLSSFALGHLPLSEFITNKRAL